MFTWLLLIILLAVLVVLGTWFWGSVFGRGEVLPPIEDPTDVSGENLRQVEAGEWDGLRFEIVPRGYRPEQVDEVLEGLFQQLRMANKKISDLSDEQRD